MTLLDELGVESGDLIGELQVVVPRVLDAWRVDGHLERTVRAHLAPFFESPEVAALLDAATPD